jgi:hypothetical protein
MTETDPEDRDLPGETFDDRLACTGLIRSAGTGRDDQMRGRQTFRLIRIDVIVAYHADGDRRIKLTDSLDEIPGEAVVVVDE